MNNEQLFKEFEQWKADQEQERTVCDDTKEAINNAVNRERDKFSKREPMQVPREYMYAAAAGALVLILSAWPVLILGAIIGGYIMSKLGCPLSGGK